MSLEVEETREESTCLSESSEDENFSEQSSDQEEGSQEVSDDSSSDQEQHNHGKEEEPEVTLGSGKERKGKRSKEVRSDEGGQCSPPVAGIVYLSRVPPFMKPHKVKHLLSQYGSVGRIYLKPEGTNYARKALCPAASWMPVCSYSSNYCSVFFFIFA